MEKKKLFYVVNFKFTGLTEKSEIFEDKELAISRVKELKKEPEIDFVKFNTWLFERYCKYCR